MKHVVHAQVGVIGGGPAGASIASRLAELGHEVCLVERDRFPRDHVGVCLPASVLPLIDVLGVRPAIESLHPLRPGRFVTHWGSAKPAVGRPRDVGLTVDRGLFDRVLLDGARERGVRVFQPAQAGRPKKTSSGWAIKIHGVENRQGFELKVLFLVDASGRGAFPTVARKGHLPRTLAVYGYWQGGWDREPVTMIEAGEDRWFWRTTLPGGRVVVAAFVDAALLAAGRGPLDRRYLELLRPSRRGARGLGNRELGSVRACDATPSSSTSPVDVDRLAVGDAALRLDPMSSQGVLSAIASALQASIVVNTLLRKPERRDAAIAFYRSRLEERRREHVGRGAYHYARQASICYSDFWRRRAAGAIPPTDPPVAPLPEPRVRLELCRHVEISDQPTLGEAFVRSLPSLSHPELARPVAFVGGESIVELLGRASLPRSCQGILRRWSQRVPQPLAAQILTWLFARRLLRPVA